MPGGIRATSESITPPRAHEELDSLSKNDELITSSSSAKSKPAESQYRIGMFHKILSADTVDLRALRELAWNGVPWQFRTEVWQLLLGYMPTNKERRRQALARKRKEYTDSVATYFDIAESDRSDEEAQLLRQIIVDLHRTCPMMPLFHQPGVQKLMERILYIWSIRHPASGYVQGMNDLLTPLFLVCLSPYAQHDLMSCDVAQISESVMLDTEADTYWCLTKLLDGIQDHYTPSQPGIQRMVLRLEDLMRRIDKDMDDHFQKEGVGYMQFSFRWMNCILLREMPMHAIIRLWDTYFSEEGSGFERFHTYVCCAILQTYRETLMNANFQDMLLFLQDMPTSEWGEQEVEVVLSQAFILSSLYEGSPSHLL